MNPILALIIANAIWGIGAPIFKITLQEVSPLMLTFLRFFIAGVIFLPLFLRHRQKLSYNDEWKLFLGSILGVSLHIPLFFYGITMTQSINAPIIFSSSPVFLYLASIFFLKEKPKTKILSGMLVALAGVLVIVLSPLIMSGSGYKFGAIEGNVLLVLSTMGMVANAIIFKSLLRKLNFYTVTFYSFVLGSIPLLPFIYKDFGELLYIQPFTIFGIAFGILFSSFVSYFLFHYGLSKIKAEEVGLFTYVDPVAAIIVAAPLLGEQPTLSFFLGSLLVFGGIFLAENRFHWHPFWKLKGAKI